MSLIAISCICSPVKAQTEQYPTDSIMFPVNNGLDDYPGQVKFSGSRMRGPHVYYTYKDHDYNKTYIVGWYIMTLDHNGLTNGLPTSRIYNDLFFTKIQRLEEAVSDHTKKIYIPTHTVGLYIIDRETGESSKYNPLIGEPVSNTKDPFVPSVLVKDDILYAPVFYRSNGPVYFYGLLEWNLINDTKRWINKTSSPVAIPNVLDGVAPDDVYWSGYKLYIEEQENRLYFSTGYGLWWWDRDDNTTGVYSTNGGMGLAAGNPGLPSNKTTHILVDNSQNKMYVGTHEGLFVWDRTNHTSRIYNKDNSAMIHNLVNHIDIYSEKSLLFVAYEDGGLLEINTQTGQEKIFAATDDNLNEPINRTGDPHILENHVASAYFDKTDKKLYVSTWAPKGSVWIRDYANLWDFVSRDEQVLRGFYDAIPNKENLPASWKPERPLSEWEGVTLTNGRVSSINLKNKKLKGNIPKAFGHLTALKSLDISQNELSGEVPTALGNLKNLDFLYLNENKLTGSVPSSFGNLSHLQVMNLGKNQLSGPLPGELGNLGNLGHLFLGYNQFSGELPPEYTNLLNLQRLDLTRNQFSGALPTWLGNLKKTYQLKLGGNRFTGNIPPAIGDMEALKELHLWSNQLTGNVPTNLGKLQHLERMHLYDNQLEGDLPFELTRLSRLRELRINNNEFTCLPDFSRLSLITRFDLFNNRFTPGCLIPNRNIGGISFMPQKPVGKEKTLNLLDCYLQTIDLGFDPFIKNNLYKWRRADDFIADTRTNTIELKPADLYANGLFGIYTAEITNPLLPGYVAVTRPIRVVRNNTLNCLNTQSPYNYMQTKTVLTKGHKDENNFKHLSNKELATHYDYIDGLGRVMQKVDKGTSPASKDLIQPIEYDALGREARQFLPYASGEQGGGYQSDYATKQPAFFQVPNDKVADTDHPYSETIFEPSPLNRVTEQGAPGTDWQPATPGDADNKTIKYTYRTNVADEVRVWRYEASSIESKAFYSAGQLYITETKDEENRAMWEYKDNQDRIVLKKVEGVDEAGAAKELLTYYVYDDFGNLRVVIPPKASATLNSAGTITKALSDSFITQGCFAYDYDARQRMVGKQVPGAQAAWMVYDRYDRLTLTQDGEQRKSRQWMFTKYDALNRPIMTGLYTHDTDYQDNPSGMQNEMDMRGFEGYYTGTADNFGYSDRGFPSTTNNSAVQVLSITYYDHYGFITDVSTHFGAAYNFQNVAAQNNKASYPTNYFTRVQGQVTGSLTRVLQTDAWLSQVNYYDERYQLIQTIGENYSQGIDVTTNEYDFAGKVLNTLRLHQGFSPHTALKINQRYLYDHAGRNTHLYMKVNEETEVLQATYQYNELGELVEKNLHQKADGSFLQSVDYRYNERGWMTHINNSDLSNDGTTNDDDDDLFGMQLHYQQAAGMGSSPQYNGNLSAVTWTNQTGATQQEGYAYSYDNLNRISKAAYKNISDNTKNGQYDVRGANTEAIRYDLNGNLLHLSRYGGSNKIDDLAYDYTDGSSVGNQLQWVTDHSTSAVGMKDGNTAGNDYGYDANGNLTKDLNKAITGMAYNHMNLPKEIAFNNGNVIRYTYDATGTKLKKEVTEAGKTAATYYLNGIQYHTMHQGQAPIQLDFIASAEGRIIPFVPMQVEPCATVNTTNLQAGAWVYQYNLTDHLGNTRLTLSSELITDKYVATMESETAIAAAEETAFLNLNTHRSVQQAYNATEANGCTEITNPNEVAIVANTTDNMLVPAKSLPVQKGDQLYVAVEAQYLEQATTNTQAIANMAATVIGSMGSGAGIETQGASKSSHEVGAAGAAINGDGTSVPPASLIILVFDQDYNQLGNPIIQSITEAAKVTADNPDTPHETLSLDVPIDQPGYVYVYLWNESSTLVYFDDFQVEHQHGNIVQADNYYPFGLAHQPREDFENKYLYNGKELQNELGLDWYDYGARMYDAALGRWHVVDPLAADASSWTPYNAMWNNPILNFDPDGKWAEPVYGSDGTYRGDTKEGFTGTVIIYDGNQEFSGMSKDELLAIDEVNTYDQLRESLTEDAKSKIWTHIASKMEGKQIYDEKFSMATLSEGKIEYKDFGGSWGVPTSQAGKGKGSLVGSDKYYYETTVENLQSSIIVHEWYSHLQKGNRDDMSSHRLAYKNVINFKLLWNNTTDAYKGFNMRSLQEYTKIETGRIQVDLPYRKLYNKYYNKY